jgi:hypothetical protein
MAEDPAPSDETLAFLFDLAKESPNQAMDQVKSLQARVTQAFTSGTVFVGFAAFATVPGSNLTHPALGALAMAGLAYLMLAVVSVLILHPTWAAGLPNPETLWRDYKMYPVSSIQQAFIQALVRDWPTNRRRVAVSKWAARVAMWLLVVEAIAMALGLVLSRI